MSDLEIGLAFTGLLLALILLRVPVAVAMMAAAVGGIAAIQGWSAAAFQLGAAPYGATEYGLSVIPLFILMGQFASGAGMARELYDAAQAVVGRFRGGLAMATVVGCAGFAAVCGSSFATAATMGSVALSEMQRHRYAARLAAGTVAAGGTIGILIPPSVILVVYAILTEQSVGQLFAAGLLPGLLLSALIMITITVWVRVDPTLAPEAVRPPAHERLRALAGVWPVALLFVVVVGGIYAGYFSPTESAGIGAFGAFLIPLLRGHMTRAVALQCVLRAAQTSAMIFLIIIGSSLFSTFLSVTGITHALLGFAQHLAWPPLAVLTAILLIYVVLGCFMDSLGMMLLTIPVFYPLILELGFDPVWFGVVLVLVVEMGLITPPVGLNVFVVRGAARGVRLAEIFRGIVPFLAAFVAAIAALVLFPELALWLPRALFPG